MLKLCETITIIYLFPDFDLLLFLLKYRFLSIILTFLFIHFEASLLRFMTLHSITCWHIKSTQLHKLKPFFVVLLNITYNGSLLSVNRAILRHFLRRKNSEIINIITSMMYSTQCLLNLITFLEGRHLFA